MSKLETPKDIMRGAQKPNSRISRGPSDTKQDKYEKVRKPTTKKNITSKPQLPKEGRKPITKKEKKLKPQQPREERKPIYGMRTNPITNKKTKHREARLNKMIKLLNNGQDPTRKEKEPKKKQLESTQPPKNKKTMKDINDPVKIKEKVDPKRNIMHKLFKLLKKKLTDKEKKVQKNRGLPNMKIEKPVQTREENNPKENKRNRPLRLLIF